MINLQEKLNKLSNYRKDKEFAIYSEQMDTNNKIDALIQSIKEIPQTEIPEIDLSATNKLLESLIEEQQKPCEISIELNLI